MQNNMLGLEKQRLALTVLKAFVYLYLRKWFKGLRLKTDFVPIKYMFNKLDLPCQIFMQMLKAVLIPVCFFRIRSSILEAPGPADGPIETPS